MRKGVTIVLAAVALAAVSCSHGVSRMRTHALTSANPTSYSFPMPVNEVHAKALQAFSMEHQYKQPIFKQPAKTDYWRSTLVAESSTNKFPNPIFNDPAKVHDILLSSSGTPVAISSVYRGSEGGLPFFATFHVQLASRGSDTVVSVKASDAQIVNGTKFGIGSCGPGQHWNYVKVKPTTVEEYMVLSYLGRSLGVTNMPPVVLPAQ